MNVKKGDTAIVIACDEPENIGIICEVGDYLGDVPYADFICIGAWYVVSNGRPFRAHGVSVMECGCADASLRPVSGLPDADSIVDQSPVKQPAEIA